MILFITSYGVDAIMASFMLLLKKLPAVQWYNNEYENNEMNTAPY